MPLIAPSFRHAKYTHIHIAKCRPALQMMRQTYRETHALTRSSFFKSTVATVAEFDGRARVGGLLSLLLAEETL